MIGLVSVPASLAMLIAPPPAQATIAAAVPGSTAAGWGTRVVFAPVDGTVTVVNGDYADHQLVADGVYLKKKIARKASWCRSHPKRSCPVFWSETISTGETTEIQGLEHIEAGAQYDFICTIHRSMTGTLIGI